jgi:hypothetical protein
MSEYQQAQELAVSDIPQEDETQHCPKIEGWVHARRRIPFPLQREHQKGQGMVLASKVRGN